MKHLGVLIVLLLLISCISQAAFGQIYVGTFDEGKVIHINARSFETTEVISGFGRAEDGVCSSNGTLFFADTRDRQILQFKRNGQNVQNILPDNTDLSPEGLSLDSEGTLYFNTTPKDGATARGAWKIEHPLSTSPTTPIKVLDTDEQGEGTLILESGPFKGHLIAAYFSQVSRVRPADFGSSITDPSFISGSDILGLAQDGSGDIYASIHSPSGRIDRYDARGNFIETFATGLNHPRHIEFDSAGNLYVADSGANRVVKISPNGDMTTIASGLPQVTGIAVCEGALGVPLATPIYLIILALGFASIIAYLLVKQVSSEEPASLS